MCLYCNDVVYHSIFSFYKRVVADFVSSGRDPLHLLKAPELRLKFQTLSDDLITDYCRLTDKSSDCLIRLLSDSDWKEGTPQSRGNGCVQCRSSEHPPSSSCCRFLSQRESLRDRFYFVIG